VGEAATASTGVCVLLFRSTAFAPIFRAHNYLPMRWCVPLRLRRGYDFFQTCSAASSSGFHRQSHLQIGSGFLLRNSSVRAIFLLGGAQTNCRWGSNESTRSLHCADLYISPNIRQHRKNAIRQQADCHEIDYLFCHTSSQSFSRHSTLINTDVICSWAIYRQGAA
jgi:hypothetical protein